MQHTRRVNGSTCSLEEEMPPIDQNLNYDFNFQVMKLILILYHVKMFYFLSLTAISDFTTTNKNNTGKYQNDVCLMQ